jgi:tellurite resistance protein
MEDEARINLLARVARSARSPTTPVDPGKGLSILSLVAPSYGSRPLEDATVPTGFDPLAVALFEAVVEGAYVVANADGVFDALERGAFERVVVEACRGAVAPQQIAALVADLGEQLREDGAERRIAVIAKAVTKKEHAHEVLRIATLLAQTSHDVSEVERQMLDRLADRCGLEPSDVEAALVDVEAALAEAASA